ncbi:hypothetical protein DFO45_5007 [Azorhizobium sp. AG788]|uniref:hypothetical protein n=1 Tax=Azorhizobium sp. AG788 TaxID=2183897 RepID=UPI00105F546C|nr:hypothetical protein [Azorhizobium sp. AG788]TDT87333.1 hypothetical protein DFO45_5007 [Azorhizobium sp. AG788]
MADELEGLELDWLGGSCPVEAEGTYRGRRLHFRARGSSWSLDLTDPASGEVWCHEEEYGAGPFDAGYMPLEDARASIRKAVAMFRDGIEPSVLEPLTTEAWLRDMREQTPEAFAQWLQQWGHSRVPGRDVTYAELAAELPPSPTP